MRARGAGPVEAQDSETFPLNGKKVDTLNTYKMTGSPQQIPCLNNRKNVGASY